MNDRLIINGRCNMTASRRRKMIIIVVALLVLTVIVVTVLFVLRGRGFFDDEKLPSPEWQISGSGTEAGDEWTVDPKRSKKLEDRLLQLCDTDYGLAAWYRLPVRSEAQPAEQAEKFISSDQLLFGRYLVEHNRMDEFTDWHTKFKKYYIYDGKVTAYLEVDEPLGPTPASPSLEATIDYAAVLMAAYKTKPQLVIWRELESLSDVMLTMFADGIPKAELELAIPTSAPAPDPAATPTPVPVITPTPEPAPVYSMIRLASIDLLTIRQLAEIDDEWLDIYDKNLPVIKGALISEQLPLYPLAVWPDLDGYLNFIGDSSAVDSRESALTTLHLAEAGELDQRAVRWINDQMLNNYAIYEFYNIIQGHPMNQIENPSVYGLTARLARIIQDRTLYEKSIERLAWHTATSQRSDALDAIFRQDENGVVTVWAEDNLRALLAY